MLQDCGNCRTRYAAGLAACPHCWTPAPAGDPAAAGEEGGDGEGEGELPKITVSGGVSHPEDKGAVSALPGLPAGPVTGIARADGPLAGTEHPADGTMAPPVGNGSDEAQAPPPASPGPAAPPKKAAPSLSKAKADG